MKTLKNISVVTLVGLLSGCVLFKPKAQPYPVGIMFPVVEEARLAIEGKIAGLILKSGDFVFYSTEQGRVVCLDAAKRAVLWTFAAFEELADPPCVDEERVYVKDPSGTVIALDRKGALVWRKKIAEKFSTRLAANGGRVVFGLENGEILALDGGTGETLWIWHQLTSETARAGPVFWNGDAVFGCDGGKILILSASGKNAAIMETGTTIADHFLVDGDALFFGAADGKVCRLDLKSCRLSWKMRTGGRLMSPPVFYKNRLYVISSNNVLTCLDGSGGDILWWKIIPARLPFALERSDDRLLVSTVSTSLYGFEAATGKPLGVWKTPEDELFAANPLWLAPVVLTGMFNDRTRSGSLVFLNKDVRVTMTPSLPSPQTTGKEIILSVEAVGFHRPLLEFYLKSGPNKNLVQKESAKNTWSWFTDKAGIFTVAVKVRDEKRTMEAEIPFEITK